MQHQPRIKSFMMSPMDIFMALSDGNPGAINVLVGLAEKGSKIDPDSMLGGIGALFALDTFAIYGPSIWMLYKDICDSNISRMIGVLRAVQLGFLPEATLRREITDGRSIDIDALLARVKAHLPNFQLEANFKLPDLKAPPAEETI